MESVSEHQAPELVTIRQFGDMAEALLAEGCLESAGIEAFLTDLNVARIDWPLTRGLRLQVSADDAAAASEVLQHSGDSTPESSDHDT
jgi:Putative prokaryotic signal transducing protein